MKRLLLLFIASVSLLPGKAQSAFSLQGKVTDSKTQEPIPFASVFFVASTLGAITKEDGSFLIDKIPSGKFELIASSVGYKKFSISILFSDSSSHLNIQLQQDVTTLKEVVVRPDRTSFSKYYPIFLKYFFGTTPNAGQCSIINSDVIDLRFDKEENALYAFAGEPLRIENKALGYIIYYVLDEFEINYKKDLFRSFGIPRFEELVPKNTSQLGKWQKKRDEAYYGSLNHFMRSLLSQDLKANGFRIFRGSKDKGVYAVPEDSLFLPGSKNQIYSNRKLKIIFDGQPEDRKYSMYYKKFQTSVIGSTTPVTTIYSNGFFEEFKSMLVDGYFAYRECLSNLVPLGYQPTSKLEK